MVQLRDLNADFIRVYVWLCEFMLMLTLGCLTWIITGTIDTPAHYQL